jgi:hypothetical protein
MEGANNYDITNISSNDTRLQDITLAKEGASVVMVTTNMNVVFTLHMPDATNPNKILVKPTVFYFPC